MPAKSSATSYGSFAVAIHWLTIPIIIALFVLGLGATDAAMQKTPEILLDFSEVAARGLHGMGLRVMLILLALHIGAVLYHQFVLRDGVRSRISFFRK